MDRIRKALDLAREDRARLVGEEATEEPAPSSKTLHHAPKITQQSPGSIVYTKTRVFSPPMDVLESHRIVDPSGGDVAAAAFRMLRTQVLQRMDDKGWR